MGCGISRYDHLHEDDDAHCRPLPPNLNKDHIHPPPIVLNNPAAPKDDNARNPLLFNSCTNINNKQPQQILNAGDPNFNYLLKHKQPQPQPQIISPSTLTSIRRHDPTMYIQTSTIKGNNNNRDHADPKLSISIKRDLGDDKEEEEENDQRFSNLDDINASSLLIGSPSFREYCVVRHDSHDFDDDDDLFNHNGNKNNIIDDQEIREIKMQREDKIMMMSNHEGSGRKKGDRRRRLKKVFPIIHRRPAPNK
ncbi:hypothetical protein ACJIZ3_015192 [Penstemon smallii]|uniref:Uncharacterized protein n=1 Tax=Penstemon smallii TaxID=265156 RepID=A0ABD3RLS2_9LAMI